MACCFGCVLCFHRNLTRAMFLKYKAIIGTQLLRFFLFLFFYLLLLLLLVFLFFKTKALEKASHLIPLVQTEVKTTDAKYC